MATAAARSPAPKARSSTTTMNAKSGVRKSRSPSAIPMTVRRADRPARERSRPEVSIPRPQASSGGGSQIVCDRGGCRPVARGCYLEFRTTAQGGPYEGGGGNVQICNWRHSGAMRSIELRCAIAHRRISSQRCALPRNDDQIALAAIFTVSANSAVLNANEMMPCTVAVRRMILSVMPTSETCAVMPITNEK
jgi:hypothetical protein